MNWLVDAAEKDYTWKHRDKTRTNLRRQRVFSHWSNRESYGRVPSHGDCDWKKLRSTNNLIGEIFRFPNLVFWTSEFPTAVKKHAIKGFSSFALLERVFLNPMTFRLLSFLFPKTKTHVFEKHSRPKLVKPSNMTQNHNIDSTGICVMVSLCF